VTLTSGSSYAWTVPTGATINAGGTGPENNSITVTFGTAGGDVTVTETSAEGCTGLTKMLAITVGCIDTTDLDHVTDMVRIHSTDPTYDLNGDGKVDIADSRWLVLHYTNPSGSSCH